MCVIPGVDRLKWSWNQEDGIVVGAVELALSIEGQHVGELRASRRWK